MNTFSNLFLIFILLSQATSSLSKCHPEDKKILLQIKKELNNPTFLSSWEPHTDCCNFKWFGVSCSSLTNDHVTDLSISNVTLTSRFPPSIGNISYLRSLFIYDLPNLTGIIPESITKLTRLIYLTISETGVTGPIPKFTSQSKSLVNLDLSHNNLFGELPPLLYKLPSLSGILFNNNKLTGSIPRSYGYFNNSGVAALDLSYNNLSGKLPISLANLDIYLVELAYNKLEGDASMLFGSNKKTLVIDISGNNFEFDFGKIELSITITTLDVSHNKIYGNFPMGMENVTFLNVSYNRLCGEIPKAVPVFLSEIAPSRIRGALNILFQLNVTIGILFANLVNYGTNKIKGGWGWRLSLGLAGIPALLLTLGAILVVDTPNSLIERGRTEEGKAVLKKIRGIDNVEPEFLELVEASRIAKEVKHPFRNLLKRKNRPQLVISVALQVCTDIPAIHRHQRDHVLCAGVIQHIGIQE
ncbi:polygalacturonase inhibitor 1-like isoform X2 [Trifolium pratense]|uniref:polygalacturonase inhibitor 1-like isoform X2 n=2 Tax=Trifolium pratense TaxID=57577 RepID=UPI001E6936D4|nr:polygalacturonase inhibitor 1-like isoform X2 [Trifolium pratense]